MEKVDRLPSPNFNARPDGVRPNMLVIHNISLPPKEYGGGYIERFFQNVLPIDAHPYFSEIADLQVSSHFLIRRDGSLVQFVSCADRAWHAGVSCFGSEENCNDFSIGVELEGCDDEAYEDAQYQSLAELSRELLMRYPDITKDRIVGHNDIAPGRKTDPGPAFDWQRYKRAIA